MALHHLDPRLFTQRPYCSILLIIKKSMCRVLAFQFSFLRIMDFVKSILCMLKPNRGYTPFLLLFPWVQLCAMLWSSAVSSANSRLVNWPSLPHRIEILTRFLWSGHAWGRIKKHWILWNNARDPTLCVCNQAGNKQCWRACELLD